MPDVAFAAPILQGKVDDWRRFCSQCHMGNDDYVASRRRLGITREAAWLQETPTGPVAVVYIEADDLQAVFEGFGGSQEPFDQWFRQQVEDAHGFTLSDPPPPPELVVDGRF